MKTTLFEDLSFDEFGVTTMPEEELVEISFMDPTTMSIEFGADVAVQVASLILSTFGEGVGVEFLPCGRAIVHSGEGNSRVSICVPEGAEGREELMNLAIAAMGAINGYDTAQRRQEEEDEAREEEAEALDREALALHNAYYGDDLAEPWTLDKLRNDDHYDLQAFRRAAQAARTVYAQATTAVAS